MQPKTICSPFKFLHSYTREDKDVFFGREEEVDKLYQYINKNRVVLVYGTSGTGKTSLVQCGLANRLEATDWMPFFIRRNKNLNLSLVEALSKSKALLDEEPIVADNQLEDAIEQISAFYLRPVYLIFDQFEELLILGDEEEKKRFINNVIKIFNSSKIHSCKMIFILREEYFAWLDSFEESIPEFAYRRLRVEPMRIKKVEEVIIKSCKKFNITLESPADNAKQIYQILADKTGFSLPYLQVYLDQLWKEDYLRTYPKGYTDGRLPAPLNFTTQEIIDFGQISDVLQRFLNERRDAVQKKLHNIFLSIPDDTVKRVLDVMVSDKGTKIPLNFIRKNELIHFEETAPEYLKTLTPAQLTACLENLELNRILRMDDASVELAHDILATLIDKERPQEQRRLNDIRRQVVSSYDEFRLTHEYLTPKQLTIYEDSIDKLDLQPDVAKFFRTSKKYRNKQRRFKWGSIAFAVLALFIFSGFEIRKGVRNDAFVKYLGNNIDTIRNKEDALRIVEYIRSNVILKEDTWVRKKFLQLFQSQEIQSKFSVFNDTISITSLKASEIDVSGNADFIVLKETNDSVRNQITGTGKYRILDKNGDTVRCFDSVYYAYFVDRSATILLAKYIDPSPGRARNILQLNGYPNTGILFNCRTKEQQTVRLGNPRAYLYPAEEIQLVNNNENDSYRIRYTASGNLVVPFVDLGDNRSGSKKIRIIRQDKSYKEIASDVSISSSKDKSKLMTGTMTDNGNKSFNLIVYDERGNLLNKYPGVDFGDFTNRGSVMFSSGTTLGLQNETGDIRQLTARSKISYAYANGDEKVVLVQTNNNLELHNDADKIYTVYDGKLIDANFEKRLFITLNAGVSDNGPGVQSDTLWRRNFSGKNDSFFTRPEGIAQVIYNKQKNQLLVLLNNYRLLLLNDSLKIQAGLQLTANDLYGFADDGNKIYYVRDKYLSVFNNDVNLINVFNFESSIKKLPSRSSLTRKLSVEERSRYNVPE